MPRARRSGTLASSAAKSTPTHWAISAPYSPASAWSSGVSARRSVSRRPPRCIRRRSGPSRFELVIPSFPHYCRGSSTHIVARPLSRERLRQSRRVQKGIDVRQSDRCASAVSRRGTPRRHRDPALVLKWRMDVAQRDMATRTAAVRIWRPAAVWRRGTKRRSTHAGRLMFAVSGTPQKRKSTSGGRCCRGVSLRG